MRRVQLVLLFTSLTCVQVAAAGLQEGIDAYRLGEYERALEELTPLASLDNPSAAYYLALMFLEGRAVTKNEVSAMRWLVRSAQSGYVTAQLKLAEMYERGEGVAQDYRGAARWMAEAAELGNTDAQYYLGMYYRQGVGVVQDDAQAYEWVLRSVERGASHERGLDALLYLGAANEWGRGRRQDLVEAYKWYSLAAGYSSDDRRMYEEAGRAMDAIRIRLSAGELAEANRRARAWQEESREMVATQ